MTEASQFGTEKDLNLNKEYCIHCYKNGAFTLPTTTLDEIIDMYAPKWGAWIGKPELSLEEAKVDLYNTLSKLKRWKSKADSLKK